MKAKWLIIPNIDRLAESVRLAETFEASFEYNDFFDPKVYLDEEEVNKRVEMYCALERDRSEDTLHGAFLDLSIDSSDPNLRHYSRQRMRQSMEIAQKLGVKGVVFHSGLVTGIGLESYLENWKKCMEEVVRELLAEYPSLSVYMENTFEPTPKQLKLLKESLSDQPRFQLCLDYGHAILQKNPVCLWVEEMAKDVGHIHLNDNDLVTDLHLAPGEGQIDMMEFKELYDKYKLDVPILLEIKDIEMQKRALEFMSQL